MLKRLANRYGTLSFNAIDNILAPAYMSRLFGRLAEGHTDLRIHYEIRPNLTRQQLEAMRRGGLTSVQPGIESFSSHVLALMRKGTTGIKGLELLKWTTYFGIRNSYNILYGFPGETADDYDRQADVLRKIPHFQPPYAICQARPDRGRRCSRTRTGTRSPCPAVGLLPPHLPARLRPAADLVLLRAPGRRHPPAVGLPGVHQARRRVDGPVERADRPKLRYVKTWDSISIHDLRNGRAKGYRYDDERAALYELCAESKSREEIGAAFEGEGDDASAGDEGSGWIDGPWPSSSTVT